LRPDLRSLALAAWVAAMLITVAPAATAREAPTQAEIDRAVEKVKADPALATESTARRLVWNNVDHEPRKPTRWPRWLRWFGDLFSWLAQISSMLVWLLLAALVALLVIVIARVFTSQRLPGRGKSFVAPTHVQDLDIRPESLPPDIGAAARELWDRGEQRAALALLYRGLLSRLAHVYEVPIRDSSTEGDCLTLAARVLDTQRTEYATRLVRTWQRAIYGGLTIDAAVLHELCAGFAAHLDAPAIAETPRRVAFAHGAAR
jgi:hypothetical protein